MSCFKMNEIRRVRECVLTSEQVRKSRHSVQDIKQIVSYMEIPVETAKNVNAALDNAIRNLTQVEMLLDQEWEWRYES